MQKVFKFELISESYIRETGGVLYEYRHQVTGTKLLYLKTENPNKLFSVTFKTIPEDHTGVFHILEHSVFCGSEKYPVKDPFLEMEKGSVNTFLNAMTFPDHTMYPVASRNEKDFQNLVSMYLDAVFRPNIYRNESIFMQEGWHYEFEGDQVNINGVVYNEMKGAEASVDSRIHQSFLELIFPNTCYRYNSGGKSEDIPKLSYEAFLAAHRNYYRPENAIFYLEGNMDLAAIVSMIENYFDGESLFRTNDVEIKIQEKIRPEEKMIEYPVMEEETDEDHWFYALGKIIDDPDLTEDEQRIKVYAGKIIAEYLTGSMGAPLQQEILMNQLGQGVEMMIDASLRQPYFFIKVRNSNEDSLPIIKNLIQEIPLMATGTLGFKEQLAAIIRNHEFRSHEKKEPAAFEHLIAVMDNYLYGKRASGNLETDIIFQRLNTLLETDYYEKLIYELLDADTLSLVIAKPSKKKAAEEKERETVYVDSICRNWHETDWNTWKRKSNNLFLWQNADDSIDEKNTLPKLSLADLEPSPEKTDLKIQEYKNVRLLFYPAQLDDMAYLNLYFPIPAKYQDTLCALSLLNNLLTNLPTERYDAMRLYQRIQELTGDLHFEFLPTEDMSGIREYNRSCKVYLVLKASFLKRNASDVMELIEEILYHTRFDYTEMIKDILLQILDMFHYDVIENGAVMGMRKVQSGWSSFGMAVELLEGMSCMDHLKELLEDYETVSEGFVKYISDSVKEIFSRDQMVLGLTYPEKDTAEAYGYQYLIDQIPAKEIKEIPMKLSGKKENYEIPIPADTGFAAAGMRLNQISAEKIALWRVACNILSTDYLWPQIRVQGGAYGTGIETSITGDVSFYTYRDPDVRTSLEVFKGCADYLEKFSESETDLEPYIISTIAKTDPLMEEKEKAERLFRDNLSQICYEMHCELYHEMLMVTKSSLKTMSAEMRVLAEQITTCLISG